MCNDFGQKSTTKNEEVGRRWSKMGDFRKKLDCSKYIRAMPHSETMKKVRSRTANLHVERFMVRKLALLLNPMKQIENSTTGLLLNPMKQIENSTTGDANQIGDCMMCPVSRW